MTSSTDGPSRTTPMDSQGKPVDEESIGFLVARLSEQTSTLVRSEVDLAKAELAEKGRGVGIGVGAFGAAGLLGILGLQLLLATVVLGIVAAGLDAWLAALIVTVVVLAAAGVAAVVGRNKVAAATPPAPEQAIAGIKEDVATVKDGITSGTAGGGTR